MANRRISTTHDRPALSGRSGFIRLPTSLRRTFAAGLAAFNLSATVFAGAAMAQTAPGSLPGAGSTVGSRVEIGRVTPAPVGHRQPRAEDVPTNALRDEERGSAADRAIDQKLQICRCQ